MAKYINRRAGSPDRNGHEAEDGAVRKIDLTADGQLRRPGQGSRGMGEFFSSANRDKVVHRGELLGFMEMLEFYRRQATWYRRLWGWLWRRPAPWRLTDAMADSYAVRTLAPARAAVEAELAKRADLEAQKPSTAARVTGVDEAS